jgi:speckle-type POZ protein
MSAGSKRPGTRTASICAVPEAARVTHSFKVVGNTIHSGFFGVGRFVRSATFTAGGHQWYIKYYPDGYAEDCKDYVSIFLHLMSKNAEATVIYDWRLVNQATGVSSSVLSNQTVFNDVQSPSWGFMKFMKKTDLEPLEYLKDDCLEIECDLAVITVDKIDVPPPCLQDDLGKLLESEEGVDAKFKVKEEVFQAHKIVLAMRSPVFRAELYGPMRNNKGTMVVDDMEPPVFKALLHFIYTDSLPSMDDLHANEYEEMAKHMLVAADRYGLERMKLMCENILCKRFSIGNVASTLVLAHQYHCSKLRDACFQFINSSNRMKDVVESKGYGDLKRACPAVAIEMLEKAAKSRKI